MFFSENAYFCQKVACTSKILHFMTLFCTFSKSLHSNALSKEQRYLKKRLQTCCGMRIARGLRNKIFFVQSYSTFVKKKCVGHIVQTTKITSSVY